MNFKLLIKRLLGRPTYQIGEGARLGRSARVFNMGEHSSQIQIGPNSVIDGQLLVFAHGGSIRIGQWCYIGEGTRIWSAAAITIGDRVMISHNVNIFDNQTHPLSASLRHKHFYDITRHGHPKTISLEEKAVILADDAWIAAGVTILKGVKIGQGSIVGAGSVVTHDIEPWTAVAGNPARVIRHLEPEDSSFRHPISNQKSHAKNL